MLSNFQQEIDPQLIDLAEFVMSSREHTVPYLMSHFSFDEGEAHMLLDRWMQDVCLGMYLPQSWAVH